MTQNMVSSFRTPPHNKINICFYPANLDIRYYYVEKRIIVLTASIDFVPYRKLGQVEYLCMDSL